MSLTISVELPPDVALRLLNDSQDLPEYAREAVAVQLFRDETLTHFELANFLGIDRFETDALFKGYRVEEQHITHAKVDADVAVIDGARARLQPRRSGTRQPGETPRVCDIGQSIES